MTLTAQMTPTVTRLRTGRLSTGKKPNAAKKKLAEKRKKVKEANTATKA